MAKNKFTLFLHHPFINIQAIFGSNNHLKNTKKQKFLDIATIDKNKNICLIQLKHSWNSKTDEIRAKSGKRWEKAIEQIGNINRKTIYDYCDYESYNVFKIALMIMPTHLPLEEDHGVLYYKPEDYAEKIFDCFCNIRRAKGYEPNFVGTIKINKPEKYVHYYSNINEIYPYVSFIAKVLNI